MLPAPGDLFSANGLQLVDPPGGDGVCDAHDPTSGNNVIVITYDLRVKNDIAPGTYTNTGQLLKYTNTESGPNFLPEPDEDDADVTTDNPETAKVFNSTGVVNSVNSNTQVVIGEVASYTVTLTIPEGTTPTARLMDTLDAGLAFVDLLSVTVSNPDTDGAGTSDDGLYSSVMTFNSSGNCTNCAAGTNPTIGANGSPITFDFGTLPNTNTNNAIDETITITYRAVALNVAGNQANTLLNNNAAFTWTGGSDSASANNVTVIEPVVNTSKTVSPITADAGDTVAFTVTLTSPSGSGTNRTTAYDVTWADSLPTGLTYTTSPSAISGSCTVHALSVSASGNDFSGSVNQLDPGETCTISFNATVDYSVAPGTTITNRAYTQWTSLPGSVTDVSSYNTNSDERTGTNPVVQPNDYLSTGPANLTINAVAPVKSLVATSEVHTGVVSGTERVTIGEIARYRLVVTLPEGTSANFQISDVLPAGLTFLDDGTARLVLVSNESPVASTNPSGATLSLALGNGPFGTAPWINGNDSCGNHPDLHSP